MNRFTLVSIFTSLALSNCVAASEQYPWQGELSFGLLVNEGNSKSKSLKSGFKLNQDRAKWRFGLDFKSLTESSEGDNTAERYRQEAKMDYKFSEFNYTFLSLSYDDDRFTDYDYQASIAAGYGRRLLNNETYHWDIEAGPGYRASKLQERNADGDDDENETIARLATSFDWMISETASFLQKINIESGSDNTFSQSETALKVMINSKFSLKLAYFVKYVEELPVGSEAEHADRETSIALLYSF